MALRSGSSHTRLWASVAVLSIAAGVRKEHADDLSMWFDELWTVFQNSRPLEQMIRERELNWPLGHTIALYGWTRLAGQHDYALHVVGVHVALETGLRVKQFCWLINECIG